ncbi:uncharacterized protein [Pocillopora verrucosa]|uniref:uncharacterized protein n=1 Tax=Pocillopora verrucosa TaxID=203993 RepID=UPI0027978413|nr:uncharacterized protein LOC131772279 [Pocillopora verrucosa]XP_058944160.1 uncharacterized protein LOC131772279 [Pocillopora verrucosa]
MADTKVFIFFVSLAWAIGAFGRPVEISEERDIEDAGFRTIDEDGDGVITSGELMMGLKMPAVRANKYMVAFDMNRDGGLQLSEFLNIPNT